VGAAELERIEHEMAASAPRASLAAVE